MCVYGGMFIYMCVSYVSIHVYVCVLACGCLGPFLLRLTKRTSLSRVPLSHHLPMSLLSCPLCLFIHAASHSLLLLPPPAKDGRTRVPFFFGDIV